MCSDHRDESAYCFHLGVIALLRGGTDESGFCSRWREGKKKRLWEEGRTKIRPKARRIGWLRDPESRAARRRVSLMLLRAIEEGEATYDVVVLVLGLDRRDRHLWQCFWWVGGERGVLQAEDKSLSAAVCSESGL